VQTELTTLLGLRHPVLLAPMAGVSGAAANLVWVQRLAAEMLREMIRVCAERLDAVRHTVLTTHPEGEARCPT
jgi:tRNA-dihydrouridine synthase